jgi:dephospho-CoA kinase
MIPRRSPEEPRVRDRWKHGAVPVLGLIGGIGGGKSSVARRLAGRGAAVIDADIVGHELLEDAGIRDRIVGRFGPGVLEAPGPGGPAGPRISRRALGAIVFHDAAALRDLEAILHPAMREQFHRTIGRLERDGGHPCIVLDAAVLLEAGWDDLCDRIAFVDAPRADRLRRVLESRGWSEEALAARERSQWPVEEKRRRADWIINNEGTLTHLDREADRLLGRLRAHDEAGASPELREIA